jgi:hypothetical protein
MKQMQKISVSIRSMVRATKQKYDFFCKYIIKTRIYFSPSKLR